MSDDGEMLTVIASLPPNQTTFEYLIGSWKRVKAESKIFSKFSYNQSEMERGQAVLHKLNDLIMSYLGLVVQDPTMFIQTSEKPSGAIEMLQILIPDEGSADPFNSNNQKLLSPELENVSPVDLLSNLVKRFDGDGLEDVISPVIQLICAEAKSTDLTGVKWRSIITALESLLQFKQIAVVVSIFIIL